MVDRVEWRDSAGGETDAIFGADGAIIVIRPDDMESLKKYHDFIKDFQPGVKIFVFINRTEAGSSHVI